MPGRMLVPLVPAAGEEHKHPEGTEEAGLVPVVTALLGALEVEVLAVVAQLIH